MSNMNVRITDNSDLFRNALPGALERALTIIGLQAEGYAKTYLKNKDAVDTGLLRNSVAFAVSGSPADISAYKADKPKKGKSKAKPYTGTAPKAKDGNITVYIGTNVEYGRYIEFGTVKMKARPYIKPSVTEHSEEYKNIVKNELSR